MSKTLKVLWVRVFAPEKGESWSRWPIPRKDTITPVGALKEIATLWRP